MTSPAFRCSRRRALGALGLGAAGAGLAACTNPDAETAGTNDPLRAEGDEIALSEIPENATSMVNFGGQQPFVAIIRGAGDDIRALSGYCTHQGCAVTLDGEEFDCPCHGSRFDADTGEVLRGPADAPLPEVEIEIDGDVIRRVR
ncbi:MAG: Rieske (2Fe-2S) protein [Brachybacterium sp.]|nr:Rieske (2Fe-2S) protein [Brachybacterium sp.]